MRFRMDTDANKNLEPWKQDMLQQAINWTAAAAELVPQPPALAPVTVAQFLLESGWGQHDAGGAKNYFGIKARETEPFVMVPTHEYVGGRYITVMAKFKKYESAVESFIDHAKLITTRKSSGTNRFIYAKALAHPNDPIAFANALTGVYATDPEYGSTLTAVMKSRGLLKTFGY